jgi:hypothetical protein
MPSCTAERIVESVQIIPRAAWCVNRKQRGGSRKYQRIPREQVPDRAVAAERPDLREQRGPATAAGAASIGRQPNSKKIRMKKRNQRRLSKQAASPQTAPNFVTRRIDAASVAKPAGLISPGLSLLSILDTLPGL